MPICPSCGKTFSGFSFGSTAAGQCRDCRKANPPAPAPARVLPLPAVTLAIIGINVAVYLAMGFSGVSWTEPRAIDAIPWGADFGPLTLSGEWWRLFTSTFVHFGIVHIGLNMWCLWNLGQALEPIMGRKIFAAMYVASGIAASMVSEAWDPWRISAGASGAIFGVAGAYVSFLVLKKTPFDRASARKNLQSMAIFIFYNLLYGLRGATDNSAHLGGLVSGLVLGALIPSIHPAVLAAKRQADGLTPGFDVPPTSDSSPDSRENRILGAIIACSFLVLCVAGAWVHAKGILAVNYGKAVKLIRAGRPAEGAMQLQDVVRREPNFFVAQALLGETLLDQQNPSAAVAPLEQAAALAPDDGTVEHNLALAYLGVGRSNDAAARISDALKSEKDDAWRSQFILVLVREQLGEYGLAVSDLRPVVQTKPDFAEAQNALTRLEAERGDGNEARNAKTPSDQSSVAIPYSKLVLKSEAWPYFP